MLHDAELRRLSRETSRRITLPGPAILVVEDISAVRADLAGRIVPISDAEQFGPEGAPGSRFPFFTDPDGNGWAVQEYHSS